MKDRPGKVELDVRRDSPRARGGVDEREGASRDADQEATKMRADPIEMSAAERAAILLDDSLTNSLPNLPKVPGWHFLWASTTNQQNPIQWFLKLGYVPVKAEEFPEWNHLKAHSGEFVGIITCNEMVGLKIPEEAYQQIMKEMHHDRPNREAERLLNTVNTLKEQRDRHGASLVSDVGDGMASIAQERTAKLRTFQ